MTEQTSEYVTKQDVDGEDLRPDPYQSAGVTNFSDDRAAMAREIEILRTYIGNDCEAQADKALAEARAQYEAVKETEIARVLVRQSDDLLATIAQIPFAEAIEALVATKKQREERDFAHYFNRLWAKLRELKKNLEQNVENTKRKEKP